MKKLKLGDWAAMGELAASVAVVLSLVYLIEGINRNTLQAQADSNSALFREVSAIEMAVAADERWSEIIVKGSDPNATLSPVEAYRFDAYIEANLDAWDGIGARAEAGLVFNEALEDWDAYFVNWTRLHLTPAAWDRVRWAYNLPSSYVRPKVEQALGID